MANEPTVSFDRYLAVLGVRRRHPGLDALSELTAAHLARIPFENVSKLRSRLDASKRCVPALSSFLDGVERYSFGGTCYANNAHLHGLLTHLGYDVALCGADMTAPNVHMVNVVTLGGRQYLVDVGYGAPLGAPVPLDAAGDHEIVWATYRYVVRPLGVDGRPRLEMYSDDVLKHGYAVNLAPRRMDDFAGVIAESFTDRATFMRALFVARFGEPRSVMLRNRRLTIVEGRAWHTTDVHGADLADVIEREFGMPAPVVTEALSGVQFTEEP